MLKSIKSIELIYKSSIVISFGMQPQTSAMQNNKDLQHQLCAKATTATASHENAKQQISQTTAANGLGLTKLAAASRQPSEQSTYQLIAATFHAHCSRDCDCGNCYKLHTNQCWLVDEPNYMHIRSVAIPGKRWLKRLEFGFTKYRQLCSAILVCYCDGDNGRSAYYKCYYVCVCRHMCVSVAILCAYVAMC